MTKAVIIKIHLQAEKNVLAKITKNCVLVWVIIFYSRYQINKKVFKGIALHVNLKREKI